MTDTYRARLNAELASLRTRRVNIRRQLDQIAKGGQFGDPHHTATLRTDLEIALRGTQARFEELHHALGLEHRLAPAVRLDAPVRTKAPVRPTARSRAVPGYITKVMVPGR